MQLIAKSQNHQKQKTIRLVALFMHVCVMPGSIKEKGQTLSGRQWPLLQYFSLSLLCRSALQLSHKAKGSHLPISKMTTPNQPLVPCVRFTSECVCDLVCKDMPRPCVCVLDSYC